MNQIRVFLFSFQWLNAEALLKPELRIMTPCYNGGNLEATMSTYANLEIMIEGMPQEQVESMGLVLAGRTYITNDEDDTNAEEPGATTEG